MDIEEAMGIISIIVEENEPDWQPAKEALAVVRESVQRDSQRRYEERIR